MKKSKRKSKLVPLPWGVFKVMQTLDGKPDLVCTITMAPKHRRLQWCDLVEVFGGDAMEAFQAGRLYVSDAVSQFLKNAG